MRILAIVPILGFCLGMTGRSLAYNPDVEDLVVESDYYQQSPADKEYDQKVLLEKERLADAQAEILSKIAELDDQIHLVDTDLASYSAPKARKILLLERKRLFRKRREYKALAASYGQKQGRMTQDLSYNSVGLRVDQRDASPEPNSKWTTGEKKGGLTNPNWQKANPNKDQKSLYVVKDEKNLKEVAQKISEQIQGEFSQDVYVQLLQKNMGNVAVNPANLIAGDHIFIPYKVALLTMMGLQQKSLLDSTLEVAGSFEDMELKKELVKLSVYADESPEDRDAFVEVLIAARVHGETSSEFKDALAKFHRRTDDTAADLSHDMLLTVRDTQKIELKGEFLNRVETVSNISLQLDSLPKGLRAKVKKAAEEFDRLKTYHQDYGEKDSRTRKQFKVFKKTVNKAFKAVQDYKKNNRSAFLEEDRYSLSGADSDKRSRSLASVDLKREIREMNSQIIELVGDVAEIIQSGWEKREDQGVFQKAYTFWWDPHKKDATRSLYKLTDMNSDTSVSSQLIVRMRVLYGTAFRQGVDLYRNVSFSLLRKRMISMIGLASAIEQVQPALLKTSDGDFRSLRPSEALRRLGIDIDKRDFDFYDRGSGARPQFQKLFSRSGTKVVMAQGIRDGWIQFVGRLSELKANFRDQDQFVTTVDEARKFWEAVSDKLDRTWGFTLGFGVAGAGVGTLAILAATNFWNPVGWATAVVVGGGVAAGAILGNTTDQKVEIEKIQEFVDLKIISDLALSALKESHLRPVEGMLYLDEIVKGY
jgi:hypothetical protein